LYRCETWSFTLRKEHRLRVFENRVLRRIFDRKREEVAGGWSILHTRVYPKVSGLAAWSEDCKWYSSLPQGAVVSLFCDSIQ
jgi:hypothetical protein